MSPTPCWASTFLLVVHATAAPLAPSGAAPTGQDRWLSEYFRAETRRIAGQCLTDIRTLEDWQRRRGEYRRQLQEMLGLWPSPERSELKPVITGRLEAEEFTVEKLQFQALPALYVTANLYLPKHLEQPAPAILYVCGHARVFTNGVSCGNKTAYQHHGEWFARNGYVCLTIDTLQLGEIEGLHHGTYREGQWWWNSRGYTPAGVEAWFGIRALDYLCTRPEVDRERIGMTGRSGGGSYTWTVAALDDRVKVAAPVAGMTDLQNQVVDGAVEGHCDCMFFVNTYRWDFPQVAALLAPRPLLIANSDKDTIFPLDGVVRLYFQTRRVYALYGQTNKLGLLITDGPHADTQDLQVPVFHWFNRFLKGKDAPIERAARPLCDPLSLRVFERLPSDQINTQIQRAFVPEAVTTGETQGPDAIKPLKARLLEQVFRGWPTEACAVKPLLRSQTTEQGLRCRIYQFESQPFIDLRLYVLQDAKVRKPRRSSLVVLNTQTWSNSADFRLCLDRLPSEPRAELRRSLREESVAWVFFAPRLVEPSTEMADPKRAVQVRRRFMLLGQTLDSMRVWDIRRAVQALRSLPEFRTVPIQASSEGEMGVNLAYAALFEPALSRLDLIGLPESQAQGPDYLNVLKVTDLSQVLKLLQTRLALNNNGLDAAARGR